MVVDDFKPFLRHSSSCFDAKRSASLFLLAFRCARQAGLSHEDSEDCAVSFVQHVFESPHLSLLDFSHQEAERYLRRCARNWTWDFCRQAARSKQRESACSELNLNAETADTSLRIESPCLCRELHKRIAQGVQQLTPMQQTLFRLRMLQNLSIQEIAVRQNRTPHAVEQALHVLRCRLRALLAEQGMDEVEARSYLSEITPPPPSIFTCLKDGWKKSACAKIFFRYP